MPDWKHASTFDPKKVIIEGSDERKAYVAEGMARLRTIQDFLNGVEMPIDALSLTAFSMIMIQTFTQLYGENFALLLNVVAESWGKLTDSEVVVVGGEHLGGSPQPSDCPMMPPDGKVH